MLYGSSLSHRSLNREGRWGTTDDFAPIFLHFSLFSTALLDLPNSRPVHSLMFSSHLFLWLPCLLPLLTVPCKLVLSRPDEHETWPYHCSLRLITMIRRPSCGPIACWIFAHTFLLITWSSYKKRSILGWHFISMACILLWRCSVRVYDSPNSSVTFSWWSVHWGCLWCISTSFWRACSKCNTQICSNNLFAWSHSSVFVRWMFRCTPPCCHTHNQLISFLLRCSTRVCNCHCETFSQKASSLPHQSEEEKKNIARSQTCHFFLKF